MMEIITIGAGAVGAVILIGLFLFFKFVGKKIG
jgi:hypothetical protein